MNQYTQIEAYKHLLQVSQNILYSVEVEDNIMKKYQELKKSITKKIIPKQSKDNHYINMLAVYRSIVDNTIKIVGAFQEELQAQMLRQNYNQVILSLNNGIQQKIQDLETSLCNSSVSNAMNKTRLLHQEEVNSLKYQYDQLDAKFQNLGLLIEVHKKMHEIILEATQTQKKRQSIENAYKLKIKEMEHKLNYFGDINSFIEQHQIAQAKLKQYKIASKKLTKVLLNQ